jgi:transcriptional regulator of met regulon
MYKAILAALSVLLILSGCNEVKRMQVLAVRHPNEFKVLANTLDPCFTGVAKSDTIMVKGKADTVLIPGSTSIVTTLRHDTVFVTKTVTTQGKKITVPIIKTIRDTVVNNRALQATQATFSIKSDSLVAVRTQLIQTKHSRSIWMWLAIGCMALIIIFIVAKVVLFFYGGGYASVVKKVI